MTERTPSTQESPSGWTAGILIAALSGCLIVGVGARIAGKSGKPMLRTVLGGASFGLCVALFVGLKGWRRSPRSLESAVQNVDGL